MRITKSKYKHIMFYRNIGFNVTKIKEKLFPNSNFNIIKEIGSIVKNGKWKFTPSWKRELGNRITY